MTHSNQTTASRPTLLSTLAIGAALAIGGCGDDDDNDDAGGGSSSTTSPTTTAPTTTAGTTTAGTTTAGTTTAGTTDTTGDAGTLLDRIVEGLGGPGAVDGLDTVQLDVTGSTWFTDEAFDPTGPAVGSDFTTTARLDIPNRGVRLDIDRTVTFEGLGAPFMFSEISLGDVGVVDGIENLFQAPTGDMLSDRWASGVRHQRLLNPHLIVKDLLADPSGATELTMEDLGGRPHERLEIADDVAPLVLWVDAETLAISQLTTAENNPLRRDIPVEVIYTNWQDQGGVRFPTQVEIMSQGQLVYTETRTAVAVNPMLAVDTFDFPAGSNPMFVADDAARGERNHQWFQEFGSIGLPQAGIQDFIMSTPVPGANGVFHLTGGSHHSLVVQQAGGVVVLEAPLYAQRCEAILDWINTNLPGESVTHVVVSHFHQDHSACARTFVAAGATLVAGGGTQTLWNDVLAAPSTIEPDALEANPVPNPTILTVPTDPMMPGVLLDDAENPIEVLALPNAHSVDMVLPVVRPAAAPPGAFIVFVADLYSPGFPQQLLPAGPQEILDAFVTHGLDGLPLVVTAAHGFGFATPADIAAAVP